MYCVGSVYRLQWITTSRDNELCNALLYTVLSVPTMYIYVSDIVCQIMHYVHLPHLPVTRRMNIVDKQDGFV